MLFIETPVFTELVEAYLSHESYVELQRALILRPNVGDIIPGGGGIRKLRWGLESRGKRGGLRGIYYWCVSEDTFYMLFLYKKNEQEDLTSAQIRSLQRLVKEYLV